MKLRKIVLLTVALLALGLVNGLIVQKERLIAHGQVVFLQLAPVDPRSLIQGDYMRLRYAMASTVRDRNAPADGYLVLKLDGNHVASLIRIQESRKPLREGELLLRYRVRGWSVRIGAESFFFQEGHAEHYNSARYAELRVAESGESVLVGLRGSSLEPLGPPDSEGTR